MSYVAKVENWSKMIFRLSSNIWYYGKIFSVLLHNGSRVVGGTFGQYPVDQVLVNERLVWFPTERSH